MNQFRAKERHKFENSRYNEVVVKKSGIAIRIGIGATLTVVALAAFVRMTDTVVPGLSILEKGELVYRGKGDSAMAGLTSTDTFMNVSMNWEEAVEKVRKELPTAIEREDSSGPYFVVPQMRNGRVLLSEFPEQSITIRPGKLSRAGARMMVRLDTGDTWAHIQVQDYRQPSALESAFNWIEDRIGI